MGPTTVERVTCTLTAETEEDLRLALDALASGTGAGTGAWKLPRTFRQAGRHVQARLTLTLGERDEPI